jgi:hypothetical protein
VLDRHHQALAVTQTNRFSQHSQSQIPRHLEADVVWRAAYPLASRATATERPSSAGGWKVRRVILVIAAIVLAVGGFYGFVILASESGEVVTLRTRDGTGRQHATRLWVVDHAGGEWVRTGHPEKGWFRRIGSQPSVEVERAGRVSSRRAVVVSDPVTAREVNDAFARKYGSADWFVALSGDASQRVVVRLDPPEP